MQGFPFFEEHANTASLRMNIFLKNLKSPFMYNKLLRRLAMKSGFLAIRMHSVNKQ